MNGWSDKEQLAVIEARALDAISSLHKCRTDDNDNKDSKYAREKRIKDVAMGLLQQCIDDKLPPPKTLGYLIDYLMRPEGVKRIPSPMPAEHKDGEKQHPERTPTGNGYEAERIQRVIVNWQEKDGTITYNINPESLPAFYIAAIFESQHILAKKLSTTRIVEEVTKRLGEKDGKKAAIDRTTISAWREMGTYKKLVKEYRDAKKFLIGWGGGFP